MADKRDIHTQPHPEGGWQNKKEGASRASKRFETKAPAEKAARDQARREGVDQISHNKDGKIGPQRSYGNDPYPPKDNR